MARGLWRSTFIGGFVAWLWVAVSWNVIPWHCAVTSSFPSESEAIAIISEQTGESGVYMAPGLCGSTAVKGGDVQVFLSINKEGMQRGPIPYVVSLIIHFIGALVVSLIIMQMAANTYGRKLFAITMVGLTIGVMRI